MSVVLPATDKDFDIRTQCVVVGGGACGLITALRLADAGIDVIVVERDNRPTGSTSMSSGFIPAPGTRVQQAFGIEDSAELFAADIQRKANNEADDLVVNKVAAVIGPALDWLEKKHGFEWQLLTDFLYPGHTTHRMHTVPGKTGEALQNQLLQAAEQSGITLVTQARVDALLSAETSEQTTATRRICGVRIQRPDGQHESIGCEYVVLACNGYGASTELMRRFIPEMADACYHGHAGNTGDAIRWGEALQVPLKDTGAYQGHGSLAAEHNILITWALIMEGGIQVNREGKRFSNELAGYSEQAVNVMNQTGSVAWNIFDERLHQLGLTFPDYQQAVDAGAVRSGADVVELASTIGLPADLLEDTLKECRALCEFMETDAFGRRFLPEQQLHRPLYAVKVQPAVFHTQGGLTIDSDARVMHKSGQSIPGLYAAGGAAAGVSGAKVSGYLSGNGLLTAVALAVIAADSINAHTAGESE
ncbi:MAG: FAD-dependent oxidoreductase [Gammaproteobacteria bacterium]|nr:FAD-dependent oxidoreductase [Gammaproteobacteria bacterium]